MNDFLPLLAQFESEEFQAGTLVLICFLPAAIAVTAFFVFMKRELSGWPKALKWVGLLPLIVGAILGIGPMTAMSDDLYRTNYGAGPRAQMLHYGGVAIPVLVAVGLVVVGILHDRQRVDEL
jgi:hypothetical protein